MTREEAIMILQNIKPTPHRADSKSTTHILQTIALEMAIKALEQEPSGDLISRQAVLNQIFYSTDNSGDVALGSVLRRRIENLPSVNPQEPKYCDRNICISNEYNGISCNECEVTKSQEPKIGHWIPTYGNVKCSVCGSVKESRRVGKATHYCDFCGAKMIESEDKG